MGIVHKFGDNIDTDVILPARYLNLTNKEELASKCMIDIDNKFASTVKNGDFIVAGENFGCGSSREQAAVAIKDLGIKCIIAKSFSRIFFRNSINIGLYVIESPEVSEKLNNKDSITFNSKSNIIINEMSGTKYKLPEYPIYIQRIIKSGGLVKYINFCEKNS